MAPTGLNTKLSYTLTYALSLKEKKENSPIIKKEKQANLRLAETLKSIGNGKDPQEILTSERQILAHEQEHYSNDPIQAGSLSTAIEGLNITLNLLEKVKAPDTYKEIDDAHQTRKRRSGGIPLDEAREFFKGHNARLMNLKKANLSEEEKSLLDVRRANIRVAEKGYVQQQKITLGIESPQKSRDKGISR